MNPITKQFIEKHIQKIINEFDFEKQKEKNPCKCVCYSDGKCHELENLNCFLCYCPEYDNSKIKGGCKINNVKGKWLSDEKLPAGKIWDCSDCEHPHRREIVEKYLRKLFWLDD